MPGDTCQIEYDSPPPGRLGHSGVLWGSKMIIFGGGKWTNSTNSTDKFNDVWQLELTNNTWSELVPTGSPPAARYGHTAMLYGTKMVIFGGSDAVGNPLNDVWQLQLTNSIWSELLPSGGLPAERHGHSALLNGNTMVIFGGRGRMYDFDGLLLIDFSASLRIYDNCSCVDYWQYTESGTVHYKFGCDTTSHSQDPWCKIDKSKCSAVIENVGTSAPDEWEKPLDENSKKYAPWRYCDGKRGVALGTGSLATPSAQVLKFASPLSAAILPGMTITISGSPCASSGVKTSAIGAAVGDTNVTLDANVTLAIPGDACTIEYSLKGKAVHGANHWTTEVDLATEVIITQFHKKIAIPGSRAAFQMGATGWSDELVDYEHRNWGNYKAVVSPVQPAPLTPCVTSADISEPSKCAGRTPLNTSVAAWRRATPISITYFAPPLSWCATQLAARGSNRTNKFQACILLTDGKNDDTDLTLSQDDYVQAFCSTFASELGGLPCTAGNIAFTMKEALNVTIIGVYMDVNQMSTENNAINLFCYSSCNNDTIARCKAQTDYNMTRSCPYMLHGAAAAIDELTEKIDGLVDEIFETLSSTDMHNDVWALDMATNTWSELFPSGEVPTKRYGHSSVLNSTTMVVFGGWDGSYCNDIWTLEMTSNAWSELSPSGGPPAARYDHSAVLYGTKMVVFGGNDGSSRNDVWILTMTINRWSELSPIGELHIARRDHSAVLYGSTMVVFGGFALGGKRNDLWHLVTLKNIVGTSIELASNLAGTSTNATVRIPLTADLLAESRVGVQFPAGFVVHAGVTTDLTVNGTPSVSGSTLTWQVGTSLTKNSTIVFVVAVTIPVMTGLSSTSRVALYTANSGIIAFGQAVACSAVSNRLYKSVVTVSPSSAHSPTTVAFAFMPAGEIVASDSITLA
eukprot:Stramenopile-MAST_4_protein_4879